MSEPREQEDEPPACVLPADRMVRLFTPANRARWGRYFNTLMLLCESAPHLSLIYQREANDHAEFNIFNNPVWGKYQEFIP
jgi:hypothetical protein